MDVIQIAFFFAAVYMQVKEVNFIANLSNNITCSNWVKSNFQKGEIS